MSKMTRKFKFKDAVSSYLVKKGAKLLSKEQFISEIYDFEISTTCGPLYIRAYGPGTKSKKLSVWSIVCKFANPKEARALGCNPYTGKWNFHEFTQSQVFSKFKNNFEKILIKV